MRISELAEYLRARRENFARSLGQDVRTLSDEERINLGDG